MWFAVPAAFVFVGSIVAKFKNNENNERLRKQAQLLQKKLKQAQKQAQTPKQFFQYRQQLDKDYVKLVGSLELTSYIKKDGRKHICFIGPTSSGKSTLVNELCGTDQKIGLGSTTVQVKPVYQTTKIVVWDAPGINKNWSTFKAQNLNFFKDLDLILVLYCAEIEQNSLLLQILEALKKQFICVRSKCDQWKPSDIKTIDEWLEKDQKQLATICSKEYRIIATGVGMREQIRQAIF